MNLLQIYLLVLTVILGLCVGSFLNVVIYRLPNDMKLWFPPSHCPTCNHKIKWYDNIPVISYIVLRGKCRVCGEKISARYPLVELLNMVLWLICLTVFTDIFIKSNTNDYVMFVVSCLACSCLICVLFCDLENMIIPDELQITLLCLGLASTFSDFVSTQSQVIGFFAGGGFFLLVYVISYAIKKKECLGFGDVKLFAVLGLLLGLGNIILVTLLASVFGAIILLILNKSKKEGANKEYPFAVFIVPAAIITLFVGQYIIAWYQSLFAFVWKNFNTLQEI